MVGQKQMKNDHKRWRMDFEIGLNFEFWMQQKASQLPTKRFWLWLCVNQFFLVAKIYSKLLRDPKSLNYTKTFSRKGGVNNAHGCNLIKIDCWFSSSSCKDKCTGLKCMWWWPFFLHSNRNLFAFSICQ